MKSNFPKRISQKKWFFRRNKKLFSFLTITDNLMKVDWFMVEDLTMQEEPMLFQPPPQLFKSPAFRSLKKKMSMT